MKIFRSIFLGLMLLLPVSAQTQETPAIEVTGFPLYAKAITPHATNPLTDYNGRNADQYVYVGVAGNVAVVPSGNTDAQPVTFVGLAAGSFVPVKCRKVLVTGTTATSLIGVY